MLLTNTTTNSKTKKQKGSNWNLQLKSNQEIPAISL